MALNRARVAKDIGVDVGLTVYVVPVEYFDSADPATTLWAETFNLPFGSTTQQLQARVVERGQSVRAALASLAAAQVSVPAGTVVSVP